MYSIESMNMFLQRDRCFKYCCMWNAVACGTEPPWCSVNMSWRHGRRFFETSKYRLKYTGCKRFSRLSKMTQLYLGCVIKAQVTHFNTVENVVIKSPCLSYYMICDICAVKLWIFKLIFQELNYTKTNLTCERKGSSPIVASTWSTNCYTCIIIRPLWIS